MEYLNNAVYVFWACTLLHLIADFNLQGILCNLKCQSWWEEQIKIMKEKNDEINYDKYENDWINGLSSHALMWSIITFLPMLPTLTNFQWSGIVLVNWLIHMIVDDLKANRHKINLRQDQAIHSAQILFSIFVWSVI